MNFELNTTDIVHLIIFISTILYELFTRKYMLGAPFNNPKYKIFHFVLYGIILFWVFLNYSLLLSSNLTRVFFQKLLFYMLFILCDYYEMMKDTPIFYNFIYKSKILNKAIRIFLLILFMIFLIILLGYK